MIVAGGVLMIDSFRYVFDGFQSLLMDEGDGKTPSSDTSDSHTKMPRLDAHRAQNS